MINYVSFFLVGTGAIIMAVSIVKYHKLLTTYKMQSYDHQANNKFALNACLMMMYFFLIGYIFVGRLLYLMPEPDDAMVMTSFVFFFGALFVIYMVTVQRNMNTMLSAKTMEMMTTLVNAIEMKDVYTRGHSQHVYRIVKLFVDNLPIRFKKRLNQPKLLDAALLHDIGKISIPDAVLNKPGKLTDEEFQFIKYHAINGKRLLDNTSFREISDWVFYHHERIDGKGYSGLSEKEIPFEAKIIAIADTFSALYTDRIYRPKFSFDKTIAIIQESAGTQLDKELCGIFCSIPKESFDELSRLNEVYDPTKPVFFN